MATFTQPLDTEMDEISTCNGGIRVHMVFKFILLAFEIKKKIV